MPAERGPSGTGHDKEWACPKCGTPGAANVTHVCMTAGEVPDPPATRWLNPQLDQPPVAVPGPASVSPAEPRDCPRCGRTYNPEPENDPGVCCICTRDLREEAKHGPGWREKVVSDARSAADPVVSPADTIREKAQQIIDRPQSPYGGSESGEEAWHWTHDWLAGFARDVLALMAVGERDRQHIAQLTAAIERYIAADEANEEAIAELLLSDPGEDYSQADTARALDEAFAGLRAVLADKEDAGA